jgi:hypothetical protein
MASKLPLQWLIFCVLYTSYVGETGVTDINVEK